MKLPIYYPKDFLTASKEEKEKICNGCGAKDGIKVPCRFWGLLIVLACNIHDWMFEKGVTRGDMIFANAMFLYNLTALVINSSNWFTTLPRLYRAIKYYLAVVKLGDNAYWTKNKQKNKDLNITYKGVLK